MKSEGQLAPASSLEPSLFSAMHMLQWRLGHAPGCPKNVVLTHQHSVFRGLAPRLRSKPLRGLSAPLRTVSRGSLAVAYAGIGAPATAVLVEELAAAGVRRIVAIDLAGALIAGLAGGSVLLAQSAFCGDGTSPHYAPGSTSVAATPELGQRLDAGLSRAGIACTGGAVWSTDAPYRETASLLNRARQEGGVAIDMETSALYAAAAALRIETVAVLVIADQLLDEWRPPASYQLIEATLRRVAAAVVDCLRG